MGSEAPRLRLGNEDLQSVSTDAKREENRKSREANEKLPRSFREVSRQRSEGAAVSEERAQPGKAKHLADLKPFRREPACRGGAESLRSHEQRTSGTSGQIELFPPGRSMEGPRERRKYSLFNVLSWLQSGRLAISSSGSISGASSGGQLVAQWRADVSEARGCGL